MATNFLLHSHRNVSAILKPVAERYAQEEALQAAIKETLSSATCDFEVQISHFDANQGTDENAVRCGASADCKECFLCAGHCQCAIYGEK